jgi:plasmid stabilization system protein ParE
MARFFLHPLAKHDLEEITSFIGFELKSAKAACRLIDDIQEKFEFYARFPELGESRPELGEHVRWFPFRKNYVVVYRVLESGIDILRILHGKDYSLLFPQG